MKKLFSVLIFAAAFCFCAGSLQADAGEDMPLMQALLTLGVGYANNNAMGDWTMDQASAQSEYYNSQAGTSAFTATGESFNVYSGIDLEGRFYFWESVGAGFSFGYHSAITSAETSAPGFIDKAEYELNLTVIPICTTLYWAFGITDHSFFTLGAGVGVYIASMQVKIEEKDTLAGDFSYDENFTSSTVGYHAKIEYNRQISIVSLNAGLLFRYASFDKFEKNGAVLKDSDNKNLKASLNGFGLYFSLGVAI